MSDLIIVAQILRPHGRRGEVVLRPLTDHIATLTGATQVYLGLGGVQPVKVTGVRLHKGQPLMKLEGIDDMTAAEALRGEHICLPEDKLAPLQEGEYFLHDLVGLTVLDHAGAVVGKTDGFVETGGPPLLAGLRPDGSAFLIPFASGTVDAVDLEKGTITLVNLPGLIDDQYQS